MKASDDLRLALGQVKRSTIRLSKAADKENEESERLVEDIPDAICRLLIDDSDHRQGAREYQGANNGEPHSDFITDQLGRRPQPAKQRILRVRGPACHDDPEHAD